MARQIIRIDREKCQGCGQCAQACNEGAIEMVEGKAKLVRPDHCDGMGNCLPKCPAGAISFVTDDGAVPMMRRPPTVGTDRTYGELSHWPIQLRLVPSNAPFFNGKELLIAADCTAFAHRNFHEDFIKGKATVIACPKFDSSNYVEKLTDIFSKAVPKSVTVVKMEVPCCSGLEKMVREAMGKAGCDVPLNVVTVSPDGRILEK